MKWIATSIAILCLLTAQSAFAYSSPGTATGFVNDFAGTLKPETIRSLESELAQFEKDTSTEITVVTIPDMGGDYIENYAVKLFEEWKLGKKDKDNGVLLLLSMKERAMHIEVGYGLEGSLVDANAREILDEMKAPLRANDPDKAISDGAHSIEEAVRGAYSASSDTSRSFWSDNLQWIFFAGIFALQWLASILARSRSWWTGGLLGVIAGLGIGIFSVPSALMIALIAAGLGALGAVFDYIVSNTYRYHASRGGTQPWWIGGNSIGGGRSGGGFGGFGGGSSGGGGASGRW